MTQPDTKRYDEGFYADQVEGSARSAAVVLPIVFRLLEPKRVIDVGCGQGAWLAAAESLGAVALTGLDGEWVDRTRLRSARIAFHPTDLTAPIAGHGHHDLAISVEVAEHLPPSRADGFVADLCRAADAVLFSAAAPQQGGTEHVNEERASRWIARFDAQGFDCFDLVRGAVWDDARVAWWYRQNLLLFTKRGSAAHAVCATASPPPTPRDLVHPEAFEQKVAWLEAERRRLTAWIERPSFGQALRALWRAVTGGPR
jgi:SAM-dependent methyltransferase